MRCPLCANEFEPAGLGCHASCPFGRHCRLICCPNCGFQTVDETKSGLVLALQRLWPARRREAPESVPAASPSAVPLSHVPVGIRVRIQRLDQIVPGRMIRLSALGLAPGATVEIRQRRPAAIVRIEHTEVALADEILDQVWVDVPESASTDRGQSDGAEHREALQCTCDNAGVETCHQTE